MSCDVNRMQAMMLRLCRIVEAQTVDELGSVSVEDRATENVTDRLENPATKNVPASWTFTQMSKVDDEIFVELASERAPSPQNTSQLDVVCDLAQSSVHVEPCHSGVTTEYQSEGEEDDLFLDTGEPSVLPQPTVACELNQVCVNNRQWMLTLLQRVFYESEITQPHEVAKQIESSTLEEVPKLFGLAAKALPTPTLAILQDAATALQTVEEVSEKRSASEVIHLKSQLFRTFIPIIEFVEITAIIFTCVSYAEARNRYRLDVRLSVCLSVCHTLALYQNG